MAPDWSARETDPAVTSLVCQSITILSPRAIAASVNRLIRTGHLEVGERLPTVRDLAVKLGVSPATISAAWQTLSTVGAIESRGRAGTFVRRVAEPSRPVRYLSVGWAPNYVGFDLSTSMPDPALLPSLEESLRSLGSASLRWTASYLEDPVHPDLRDEILEDWPYQPERLVTVEGALDGLSRVIDQIVSVGVRVVVEDPGFPALIDLLEARGAEVVPVALDDQGMLPDALAVALVGDPVAVFLHSRSQNPTGAGLTADRRDALAKVLKGSRALIVEADHSGMISRAPDVSLGTRLPERTVHIRSYSKSHGPDLRTAALAGPADVVDPLMSRRMLGPGWTSQILQSLLLQLLRDPSAQACVARARSTYQEKTTSLTNLLEAEGLHVHPGDGVNLWVGVNNEHSAMQTLAAAGVRVAPGSSFSITPNHSPHIRITTAHLPDDVDDQTDIARHIVRAARATPGHKSGVS